jgi:peptidylprolyl isomerase
MNKKTLILAAALAALSAAAADAQPKKKGAAPAKPAGPAQPGPRDWRTPNPDEVVVIDTNKGRIVAELVPEVAPNHVARIQELAREHFYDGLRFFRVIDGFMDQTGDPKNDGTGDSPKPNVNAEFIFRRGTDTPWALVSDQVTVEHGFIKSMPVASQSMSLAAMTADGKVQAWGLYCPGVLGMARADDPNSANSQFFLMRDAYPRLEKRYTAFGRVISGQDVVTAIKVGEPVADPQDFMERVRLLSDMPEKERPKVRVIDTNGAWFKAEVARVKAEKGPVGSACDVNVPVEVK